MITIVPYTPAWRDEFSSIGSAIRQILKKRNCYLQR